MLKKAGTAADQSPPRSLFTLPEHTPLQPFYDEAMMLHAGESAEEQASSHCLDAQTDGQWHLSPWQVDTHRKAITWPGWRPRCLRSTVTCLCPCPCPCENLSPAEVDSSKNGTLLQSVESGNLLQRINRSGLTVAHPNCSRSLDTPPPPCPNISQPSCPCPCSKSWN